jgi:Uma2 family endonuclease
MRTVVLDPAPVELQQMLELRRRRGLDLYDEVWDGEYHVVPAPHSAHGRIDQQLAELLGPLARTAGLTVTGPFNLGEAGDFRVPDRGVHRSEPDGVWVPTAAIVVEIVSPGDETWEKLGFYAKREVSELLIIDPEVHAVHWLALAGGEYRRSDGGELLGLTAVELAHRLTWPKLG